ncbi:adhesion G protein-coupled receptor L4-like [Ptychodera flava]|uniref:adhesion G protein-coupled receptor L4-like n=1 Tax=Ptychodera flava TaxID=63121 RepID=UPI003969C36D
MSFLTWYHLPAVGIKKFAIANSSVDHPLVFPDYEDSRWNVTGSQLREGTDNIRVPHNIFEHSENGFVFASFVTTIYNSLHDMYAMSIDESFELAEGQEVTLGSRIFSLQMSPSLTANLDSPVEITLQHTRDFTPGEEPACAHWNFSEPNTIFGAWSTSGCSLEKSNATHTTCHCSHLTNFVIAVKSPEETIESKDDVIIEYITLIGGGVSIGLLTLLIIVYLCVDYLRTIRYAVHINAYVAVIGSTVVFILNNYLHDDEVSVMVLTVMSSLVDWLLYVVSSNPIENLLNHGSEFKLEHCNVLPFLSETAIFTAPL